MRPYVCLLELYITTAPKKFGILASIVQMEHFRCYHINQFFINIYGTYMRGFKVILSNRPHYTWSNFKFGQPEKNGLSDQTHQQQNLNVFIFQRLFEWYVPNA